MTRAHISNVFGAIAKVISQSEPAPTSTPCKMDGIMYVSTISLCLSHNQPLWLATDQEQVDPQQENVWWMNYK
jgi:hypothetical protein